MRLRRNVKSLVLLTVLVTTVCLWSGCETDEVLDPAQEMNIDEILEDLSNASTQAEVEIATNHLLDKITAGAPGKGDTGGPSQCIKDAVDWYTEAKKELDEQYKEGAISKEEYKQGLAYLNAAFRERVDACIQTQIDRQLTGAVTDIDTGQPIAGARVTFLHRTVVTDADGIFTFEKPLPLGSHNIVAMKDGYSSSGTRANLKELKDEPWLTAKLFLRRISTEATIGPEGGQVEDGAGNSLIILPGALNHQQRIWFAVQPFTSLPFDPDARLQPGLSVEIQPSGITFAHPCTLVVQLSEDDPAPTGEVFPVLTFDEITARWLNSGLQAVISEDGLHAIIIIDHLSTYSIGLRIRINWVTSRAVERELSRTEVLSDSIRNTSQRRICSRGAYRGGRGHVTYNISVVLPFPIPGVRFLLRLVIRLIARILLSFIPFPGDNYPLVQPYYYCAGPCSEASIKIYKIRVEKKFITGPDVEIRVPWIGWVLLSVANASVTYDDLVLEHQPSRPLDPGECHDQGGGG